MDVIEQEVQQCLDKSPLEREEILRLFSRVKSKYSVDIELKEEQLDLIQGVLNRQDCMDILGTGFGKSFTYILPPLLLDEIDPCNKHVSLVISPLRSLMSDQVEQLQSYGVKATAVLQKSEITDSLVQNITHCAFSVVFMSPESANSDLWSGVLRDKPFKENVSLVAIDEAHCVIHWGKSFREDYLKLSWLRPVMHKSPFLFLTATCTREMKDEILRVFNISAVQVTAALPDRPNIFLKYISDKAMKMADELTFYIDDLREKGVQARKCIIYTRVNPAGEVYEEIVNRLEERVFTQNGKRMVDIFVANTSEVGKAEILEVFPLAGSHIRCLIASTAFGMGVNIPDVELVVHWGASSNVLSYWQEVGRAGRDGRRAEAIIFATPQTVSDKRICEDDIRDLQLKVRVDNSCVRLAVLRCLYLDCMEKKDIEKISEKERCQSNCQSDQCVCQFYLCCSKYKAVCPCSS